MLKIIKENKFLISIFCLALVLRFYQLGSLPALNADEAAIGYNAYSLIHTGLDEHGNSWPIHFQSFNDYKPGLTIYLVMPFVKFFGLNVWSVRVMPAFLGALTVFSIYYLVIAIWPNRTKLALYSSLLLAISPWHIHFSRGAWEVNIATFLITSGLVLFYKSLKESKYFAISAILFVLSMYTYHAARIVVPLLGVCLALLYRKHLFLKKNFRLLGGAILLFVILLIPLGLDFIGAGTARAGGVSIFSDRGPIDRINEKRGEHEDISSFQAKVLHNKPVEYLFSFSENYFEHFWGEFLFLSSDDIQRNKVPEFGLLYLIQAPLLIFSFVHLSRNSKDWGGILSWLLIAPIAASLTFQSPHALRAQSMIIPLTIISAYGLASIKKLKIKPVVLSFQIFILVFLVWDFSRYLHQYYSHMSKTYSYSSQYSVEEMVEYINSRKNEFQKIYITDRYDQPYILYLFYSTYPPEKFQSNHQLTGRDKFGFSTVREFDNLVFDQIDWDALRDKRNILVIGSDKEINEAEANVVKKIKFPSGDIAFKIVEL